MPTLVSPTLAGFGPLGTPELIIIGVLLAIPAGIVLLVLLLIRLNNKKQSPPTGSLPLSGPQASPRREPGASASPPLPPRDPS